jgi:hypothetical protein
MRGLPNGPRQLPLRSSRLPQSFLSLCHQTRNPKIVTAILFAVIFTLTLGAILMTTPAVRLIEDRICHFYFNGLEGKDHIGLDEAIDEETCKADEVQKQMASLFGTLTFLAPIPGRWFLYIGRYGRE